MGLTTVLRNMRSFESRKVAIPGLGSPIKSQTYAYLPHKGVLWNCPIMVNPGPNRVAGNP